MDQRVAARSKKPGDPDDAPAQESMRGSAEDRKMSRNPDADQRKIRRQMAKQASAEAPVNPRRDMTTIRQREAQILTSMASATTPERQVLARELEAIRTEAARAEAVVSEIDLASSLVYDHLSPVPTHEHHTAATDWVGETETDVAPGQVTAVHHQMLTEASLWFGTRSPEVRRDREEFGEQAMGMARRVASSFGSYAPVAQRAFLDHVGHLWKAAQGAEGPLVSDQKAVGDDPNAWKDEWPLDANGDEKPNTVPWSEQQTTSGSPGEARPSDRSAARRLRVDNEVPQAEPLNRTSSRRTAADPQSGEGISTLDPGHPVDAVTEPWLSEDWPGGEAPVKPSSEAPVMQENSGGPTGGPNDSTFGGDSSTKEGRYDPLQRRDGEGLIAWQARLTAAGQGIGAPVPFGDRPVRSVAGAVCPRCGAGRGFIASSQCRSCGFILTAAPVNPGKSTEPGKALDFAQDDEGISSLPYNHPVNEQNRPMWPWEMKDPSGNVAEPGKGSANNDGAADVADVPTPGGESGYPQPRTGHKFSESFHAHESDPNHFHDGSHRPDASAEHMADAGSEWRGVSLHEGATMEEIGGVPAKGKSRNCYNGNHSDCSGGSCRCPCHRRKDSALHTALKLRDLDDRPYDATCSNPSCPNHGVSFVRDDFSGDDDDEAECPDCDAPLVFQDGATASRHTAVDSSGHSPIPQKDAPYPFKDGANSTCRECGRPVQAMEGIWYHLKGRSAALHTAEEGSDSPTSHLEEVTQPETTDVGSTDTLKHPPGNAARPGGPAPYNAAPPLGVDHKSNAERQAAFRSLVQANLSR